MENIGDEGCSLLSKAQWNLYALDLCISCVIELETISELQDAVISRMHSGQISTYLSYVSVVLFRQQQNWSLRMQPFVEGLLD